MVKLNELTWYSPKMDDKTSHFWDLDIQTIWTVNEPAGYQGEIQTEIK